MVAENENLTTDQRNNLEGNTIHQISSPLILSPLFSKSFNNKTPGGIYNKSSIFLNNNNQNNQVINENSKYDINNETVDNNPVKRFENFQKQQEIIIKAHNKIQEEILKNEKNFHNSKTLRTIDSELYTKKSEKTEMKQQQQENLIKKQNMDQKLFEEMKQEAEFYKGKILESLNLNEKNKQFQMENFEKNINHLGLDLVSIDPKLKKFSKMKISSEIIMKKIQERLQIEQMQKEELNENKKGHNISEGKKLMEDFFKKKARKQFSSSLSDLNPYALAKPQLNPINSMRNLNAQSMHEKNSIITPEFPIDTSININVSSLEKRLEYEGYRNIINRDLLKEKKRKIHEMKIREMYKSCESPLAMGDKDAISSFNNQEFFSNLLKENLKERQKSLVHKIKKRKVNLIHMKRLANYIIDFVEEIHKYQTDKQCEEIKIEDWRVWTSMFINNQPYSVSLKSNISYFDNNNKISEENEDNNENSSKLKFFETVEMETTYSDALAVEAEILDYVNYKGKYFIEIIPEEALNKILDFFDIMGNDIFENPFNSNRITGNIANPNLNEIAAKRHLLARKSKYRDYEPKDEDIENLTIPKIQYHKNFFLSDIIEIAIDMKYNHSDGNNNNYYFNSFNNNANQFEGDLFQNINSNTNNNNNYNSILDNKGSDTSMLINNISYKNTNTQTTSLAKYPLKHIPIKIILLGKKFSGKKTQAKLLADSYGLKIYSVEDIIKKNLDLLEKLSSPIDQDPKFKNLKKNELDKLLAERHIEEQKFEPIKPKVIKLKEILYKTEDSSIIKDEAMADFVIDIIKNDFPEKLISQVIEEIITKNKRKKELSEELAKLKEEKLVQNIKAKVNPNVKNESYYIQELHKLNLESNKGFVIVDFPNSLTQAKIFERKLTGYTDELGKNKTEADKLKDTYSVLLDITCRPLYSKGLVESGIDVCLYLEADSNECLRRGFNRKYDPQSGVYYHLEDNPPNSDDKKLLERLIDSHDNMDENQLKEGLKNFNLNVNQILEFYNLFGYGKMNFKLLNKIPIFSKQENSGKDYKEQIHHINSEITQIINHLIKVNEEKEIEFLSMHSQLTREKDKDANNPIHATNYALNTNSVIINNNIITIGNTNNNNFAMTNNNNNLVIPNTIIPSVPNSNLNSSMNKELQKTKTALQNGFLLSPNFNSNSEGETRNNGLLGSGQVQNLDEDDFNKYSKKLQEAKRRINSLVSENILSRWNKMYDNYTLSLKVIFKNIKKQKDSIIINYNKLQEKFIEFLGRPSKKNVEIYKYQNKFNKFLEEYPQLVGDLQVKAEFKQDLADLGDRIWEIIDDRKEESIKERKKIMQSGWIEKEMEKFYLNIEKLVALEIDKFFTSFSAIREFYLNMDIRIFHDLSSNFNPADILNDDEVNMLPLEQMGDDEHQGGSMNKTFVFPRLEKLYKNAIKLLLKLDDVLKGVDKIIKNSSMNSSLDISLKKGNIHMSRGTIKNKIYSDSTFVDERREIFIYEEEMKNAIKQEKNKFKYRVTFLKYWAFNILSNMRRVANVIYDNLDLWIIDSIKAENNAMNNLAFYLESHIDKESRVKCEMEMDSFDIFRIVNVEEIFDIAGNETTQNIVHFIRKFYLYAKKQFLIML